MQTRHFDYLIIGAGPSGLQLGYFLEKAGYSYQILEAGNSPGTFFKRYPRHRKLISINKVYTGYDDPDKILRWDWNSLLSDDPRLLFKNYSQQYFPHPDDLVEYLDDFARRGNLKIQFDTKVTKIAKDRVENFALQTQRGDEFTCTHLVIATGFTKPYYPKIEGIELAEQYQDMPVDPKDFIDQDVLIIGKGNSGFETADNLIETTRMIHICSPYPLNLAWKTHFVGHLRAVNNNLIDTYQLKSQNGIFDAMIEKIERVGKKYVVTFKYAHASGEVETITYDRVLACTGFSFDSSIFDDDVRPALSHNDRLPQMSSEWESTNVKNMYFVGTLTQQRDYKKTTSGFIHGFRYNVRTLFNILNHKYHDQPLPHSEISAQPQALLDAVMNRLSTTSALWQQFGFLGDVISISPDGQKACYYPELPIAYVKESKENMFSEGEYYTLTLEYGPQPEDVFNYQRQPFADKAELSAFLHPIIRHYKKGMLVAEQHLLEDLTNEWNNEVIHKQPLLMFFQKQSRAETAMA